MRLSALVRKDRYHGTYVFIPTKTKCRHTTIAQTPAAASTASGHTIGKR